MNEAQKHNPLQVAGENDTLLKKIKNYKQILEAMEVFSCDIDPRGIIHAFDLRFCKRLNLSKQDLLGLSFRILWDDSSLHNFTSFLDAIFKTHPSKRYIDTICLRKGDVVLDAEIFAIPQTLKNGISGYRLLIQDISHRKKTEDLIRKLAFEDILTGLPNRRLFMDRLSLQLNHAKRSKGIFAVVMMDLDYFKEINDTKGHAIGDQLLHSVARRLVKTIRDGDTVARIGGDEFIFLFPALRNMRNGARIGDKIVTAFKEPFLLEKHEISISASIGIAIYPDHGDNISLLRNSDCAMYAAKKNGRNRYEIYTKEMEKKII
ncbi:MAG: sensor domain-containing diguanylate cyclase [Syntrophobacterales bacterium]|jgi:diguanylate cyclase (GGDEF)-like protein/PAS domain S-box-containing protein|nr:sensor domain-containing diguanylate cyclase [Syntrophobacterales bacterium]